MPLAVLGITFSQTSSSQRPKLSSFTHYAFSPTMGISSCSTSKPCISPIVSSPASLRDFPSLPPSILMFQIGTSFNAWHKYRFGTIVCPFGLL